MPIIHELEYYKPASLDEAVRLLSTHEGAQVLAGGTDLVNLLKDESACAGSSTVPRVLVDIKGLDGLGEVSMSDGRLSIGALVTFTDLIESAVVWRELPLFVEVARTMASAGIRNRATLVGNICSAVPCTDAGPLLCAYDADVVLRGPRGERTVPVARWFVRPRHTAILPGEIVVRVVVPVPGERHGGCFVKLMRYAGEDLAQASVCVLALPDRQFRVAFGAVAPVPIRSPRIEQMLEGQDVSDDLVRRVQGFIPEEIAPITDVRASREYRTHMVRVMFERALRAAVSRLAGEGPAYGARLV